MILADQIQFVSVQWERHMEAAAACEKVSSGPRMALLAVEYREEAASLLSVLQTLKALAARNQVGQD